MSQYENAKIDSVSLGFEDHGIFTVSLGLDMEVGHIGFGGFALDSYQKDNEQRKDTSGCGLEFIRAVLETVGVEDWSELKGKYVHIERDDGWNGKVTGIRHIVKDKWFRPEKWFEENYGTV